MKGSQFISLGFLLAVSCVSLTPERFCSANSNSPRASQMNQQGDKPAGSAVLEGIWGGVHIRMEVTGKGALMEYDCARGTISEPLIIDSEGRFQAKGTHVFEHGGPIRERENPVGHSADYTGNVKGKTMTLTVRLSDSSEVMGTFTLLEGNEGRLLKCR